MDFELKKLGLAQATTAPTALLVILLGKEQVAQLAGRISADNALSQLIAQAQAAGDFDGSAGQLLQTYRPQGIQATRLILAGVGEGAAREAGKALGAALAAFKPPASQDAAAAKTTRAKSKTPPPTATKAGLDLECARVICWRCQA
ncbi:MAG: hypothetical protein HC765_09915 [Brachymonas sp.]|nr:hypothetical protein [Brachymonas sp.]